MMWKKVWDWGNQNWSLYLTVYHIYFGLVCVADDFQLGVVVTEEGLMLTVTLQTASPGPVRLRIKYTWAVQPDTVEWTTSTTFENMREIVHMVSGSEVPFQQFRFQVALQVGGVVGPFVPDLENATAICIPDFSVCWSVSSAGWFMDLNWLKLID